MLKNAAIAFLLFAVVFLAFRVVHLENRNYAMQTGLCEPADFECLETVQTRTSWLWNLFYGITD